jgi:hypothetical protein
VRRLIPPFLGLVAIALVPWALWLTTALPSSQQAEHWDIAWGGLDLMLAAALLATAVSAWRRGPLVQACAAAAGTLLVVDAWFDLLTSSGRDLTYAIVLAALCELPLAGVCLWIVIDSEHFYAQAWRLLARDPGLKTRTPAAD